MNTIEKDFNNEIGVILDNYFDDLRKLNLPNTKDSQVNETMYWILHGGIINHKKLL